MNEKEILYQIVAINSEHKVGYPEKITTIMKNGCTGKAYTDYDFKNHRYLYCYVSDNFNVYDRLEEKDKEIERLNNIINELKSKIWQIKDLKKEWLDINENSTLVFENNNLIEFMNKLERILKEGDNND